MTGSPVPRSSFRFALLLVMSHERPRQGGVFLIVQDIYPTETAQNAHLVLPAAQWGEMNLTSINGERRLRLYQQFMDAPGIAEPD